jgi:hypothetical protein
MPGLRCRRWPTTCCWPATGRASRCPSTPLLETAKGEQKEGFDIVVHDGDTGDSKSVGMMSGGERTLGWTSA